MIASTVILLVALAGAEGDHAACGNVEAGLRNALVATEMRMEPEAARLRIHEEATRALERCPASEGIAYVSLRASELVPDADGPEPSLRRFVQELAARFPRSARIATIRARMEGTVDTARRAVAADAAYAPAQVALAAALLEAGDRSGARDAIDGVKDLGTTDEGYAVLARIKWTQGDGRGAMEAAQRQLKGGRRAPVVEPGSGDTKARSRAHEILALGYLKQGQADKAAAHLLEAQPASSQVKALLASPGPALRQALARQRRARR
jgi:hypothetical protein